MPSINSIIAHPLQCPIDIAMQEAGSIEALFDFALANGISITDDMIAGNIYTKPAMRNKSIAAVFYSKLKPASAYVWEGEEGIDYWQIERNNIVS